jgi:superfamily II DNA/RNA helicase
VPHHADDYVHRVGRTARAGRSGTAISIVAPQDRKAVAAIEKLTGQTIAWMGDPPAAPPHRGHRDGAAKPAPKAAANHRRAARPSAPRNDPVRPVRPARPAQPAAPSIAERDQSGGHETSHLPAFLLRPVPARA